MGLVGGATHLMMISIWTLMCRRCDQGIPFDCSSADTDVGGSALLALVFVLLFSLLWSVMGFVTWSQMDESDTCSKMVLSWSVIESAFILCVCALPFLFCWC